MRRLNAAAEAVLAFAIVNRRLPCPANCGDHRRRKLLTGATDLHAPAYGGFLPARTLGFQPVDAAGYGVDSWNNRIRYAVAQTVTGCTGAPVNPAFRCRRPT